MVGFWGRRLFGLAAGLCLLSDVAFANLVTNGNFTAYTQLGTYNGFELDGASATCTALTSWTSGNCTSGTGSLGYNFLFTPTTNNTGTSGHPGSYSPQYSNYMSLFDASNGGATGNTWNGQGPSPVSNFVALDGAYQVGALTQLVSGLVAGRQYTLWFNWAGAQQTGYTGATTEGFTVTLGSQSLSTATANNISQGFTGWMTSSMTFTATAASETLSFLAFGTPSGQPPFSLLANVDLEIPEPAAFSVLGAGLLGVLIARRRRL